MVTLYRFIQNVKLVDSLNHFRLEATVTSILEAEYVFQKPPNISNKTHFDNNLGTLFMLYDVNPIL